MKKAKPSPELEKFLRKEKVLTKFKKNTDLYEGIIYEIGEAFPWSMSPEGDFFWRKLEAKFRKQKSK